MSKKPKDKYIVTSVCADDLALPGTLWGKIRLSKEEAKRIVSLIEKVSILKMEFSNLMEGNDLYCLEFWDYSCEYFVGFRKDDPEVTAVLEESDYCVTDKPPEGREPYRVCAEILRVMDDGVLWTAKDKCNGNPIETQRIGLSVFTEFLEEMK